MIKFRDFVTFFKHQKKKKTVCTHTINPEGKKTTKFISIHTMNGKNWLNNQLYLINDIRRTKQNDRDGSLFDGIYSWKFRLFLIFFDHLSSMRSIYLCLFKSKFQYANDFQMVYIPAMHNKHYASCVQTVCTIGWSVHKSAATGYMIVFNWSLFIHSN